MSQPKRMAVMTRAVFAIPLHGKGQAGLDEGKWRVDSRNRVLQELGWMWSTPASTRKLRARGTGKLRMAMVSTTRSMRLLVRSDRRLRQ